jgi:hypothetical protein
MNIGDWLPVMATFSACWQTTITAIRICCGPRTLRASSIWLSDRPVMRALGLVEASKTGTHSPTTWR